MIPDDGPEGVFGPETDVPVEQLWPAMVDKVRNPAKYLPGVESVELREHDDHVYREMRLANGATMREDIYLLEARRRIEFRVVDRPLVVVNQYVAERRAIEYRLEDPAGKCLGWWVDGREGTVKNIANQYETARKMSA